MLQRILLIAFYSILGSLVQAQQPIRVDAGPADPNETSMCINRSNPANLIGGSNIHQIYISEDTGNTWQQYTAESVYGVYGDPVLMSSHKGRIYFAHLARNPEKKWPDWFDRIVVQYSTDGGKSFSNGASIGFHPQKMQDKPWLNLDEWPLSPYKDRVFVSWTEFDKYKSADPNHHSNIKVSWSEDGGITFSPAFTVSDISGSCLDDDNSTEGATTASLPDGTLCIAWSAFGKIWFDQSKDGGKTWGKDRVIATQKGGWEMDIQEIYRANGFPFLVADKSNGPHRGRLYLFYGDASLGDADEWLIWSDDNGKNWSEPLRLNTDAPSNGRDQFMGHFALDQEDGNWYAIFYDQRYGSGSKELDVTLAWGNDTMVFNRRLTPEHFPSPEKNKFFGDYISLDAFRKQIVPCWTANYDGLGIYMLHLNSDDLKPHSVNTGGIKVIPNEEGISVFYSSGLEGMVELKGKIWKIFPAKQTLKIVKTESLPGEWKIPVNSRRFQKVTLQLKQPDSTLIEQSVWQFRK